LTATSSFVVARAADAGPKMLNTLAANSIAVVIVPAERILYSSTGISRRCPRDLIDTGSGVLVR
jgi:hypothetical protein